MTATINGIQYIGGSYGPNDFINNQAASLNVTQTIENGVLAGPISIPATVTVTGAATDQEAQRAARFIANSPLVKTALHGEDPNWGRIVAVAGRSGVAFDQAKTEVRIGSTTLFANATVMAEQETLAAAHLAGDEVELSIDLGTGGSGTARMWTCDFSAEYVHINADYRT